MKKQFCKIKHSFSRIFSMKSLSSYYYYYPRYTYYERILSKYRDGQFYLDLIKTINKKNKIKTNKEIKLIGNKILNEISIKDIVIKYGKPKCKIICEDLLGIKVLLFKQKLGMYKSKIEFHFLNNNLFFYSYTFSDLKIENKNEIIQIIKYKYLDEGLYDLENNYIVDKNNIIILLNDHINFSIYYLCDNKISLEKIMEYIDSIKEKNENKQEMYREILYDKL